MQLLTYFVHWNAFGKMCIYFFQQNVFDWEKEGAKGIKEELVLNVAW